MFQHLLQSLYVYACEMASFTFKVIFSIMIKMDSRLILLDLCETIVIKTDSLETRAVLTEIFMLC